jgi:CubicO group peptidase (beta-lactamase class C family)
VPAWPHTKLRIGSVSKSLTAAAVGLLVEQGLLNLDAPVQRYVPSFPEKRYPVTTRQAAGHLAGIRHYVRDEFLLNRRYSTVAEGLSIFQNDSLLHEPGTKYLYPSYGWNLVSAVVESASGDDYLSYMDSHVIYPLGLRQTIADHNDSLIDNRTRFYELSAEGRLLNAPYVDNSYKWAGGGYLSTAEDLVRFGHGLLTGRLLKAETVELLFSSQKTSNGTDTGYGIGFASGRDEQGRRWVGHGGGSVGGTTQFVMYPAEGVEVAIIANLSDVEYKDVHRKIAALFFADE